MDSICSWKRLALQAVVLGVCSGGALQARTLYVSQHGQEGADHFKQVQAAIDAAPAGTAEEPTRILIDPGTYKEHLTIPRKDYLSLVGTDSDATRTVLTFDLCAKTPKKEGSGTVGTTGSASTTIHGEHFTAINLTFENSTPYLGSQAVAVKTQADEIAFENCRFLSFQDTLYPTYGRAYFKDCYIRGSVDFIFGNATAVFDHCTINSAHPGQVTAANTASKTAIGFVFLDCTLVSKDPGCEPGQCGLGRPWQWDRGSYASTIFVNCKVGPQISPELWSPWSKSNTNPAGDTRYAQFGLTDQDGKPLDVSKAVNWSHNLTADQAALLTLPNIFGPGSFWNNPDWGVGGKLWGPLNDSGQNGVKTAPADKTYGDWPLGGTWDPAAQISAAKGSAAKQ